MILGLGTDMVLVSRLESALSRTPKLRDRLFHPAERQLTVRSLAARFAAKEALAKALGDPAALSWSEIRVTSDARGKPSLQTEGASAAALQQLGVTSSHVSLSHDGDYAIATVILERSGAA